MLTERSNLIANSRRIGAFVTFDNRGGGIRGPTMAKSFLVSDRLQGPAIARA